MKLNEFYKSEDVFGVESTQTDKRQKYVINFINQLPGPISLLDFGCGTGFLKHKLHDHILYHGCDIAVERDGNDKIRVIMDDTIPFDDNSFDILYAGEVIEHLIDTDLFMREVRRVLKNDGQLIITTPNLACWSNRIMLLIGYQPYFTELSFKDKTLGRIPFLRRFERQKGGMGHLRIFTMPGLRDFIEMHNFIFLSVKTIPLDLHPIYYFLDRIFGFLGMASDIVMISRKSK